MNLYESKFVPYQIFFAGGPMGTMGTCTSAGFWESAPTLVKCDQIFCVWERGRKSWAPPLTHDRLHERNLSCASQTNVLTLLEIRNGTDKIKSARQHLWSLNKKAIFVISPIPWAEPVTIMTDWHFPDCSVAPVAWNKCLKHLCGCAEFFYSIYYFLKSFIKPCQSKPRNVHSFA